MNVSGSVWDFSSPLGNGLLVSWTESFLMLTFVPSLYLGKVGRSRRPYLQRMAKEGLTVNVRTLSPQWYVVEWDWRGRGIPRAFPSCLIPTLNRASKRPSETLKVILLKGSGSRSELIPAVSGPFWVPIVFETLPVVYQPKPFFVHLNELKQDGNNTEALWVAFSGSQERCWRFCSFGFILIALLEVTVQFEQTFFTSEMLFRSCRIFFQYLPLFFHFKSCSICQLAHLSWGMAPLEGTFSLKMLPEALVSFDIFY